MKSLLMVLIGTLIFYTSYAQNVGVGTITPQQKLDVNGAIKVGTTGINQPGTIRFNAGKFEGGDGTNWKNFEGTASGIVGTKLYNNPALLNAGYSLFGEIPGIKSYSTINTTFPANTWQPSYTKGIVTNVSGPESGVAVWSGSLMYVATYSNLLYSYNPTTDIWSIVSNQGSGNNTQGIWTGTEIIFWDGGSGNGTRYNPATNLWTALPITNAPSLRGGYTTIWDGSRVIIWGGASGGTDLNTGAMYNPATNTWATMNTSGALTARHGHTAIWNNVDGRMIIWGGLTGSGGLNTGGQFNPVSNTWTGATNITGAPAIRYNHTAVWTGTEMIIFGGQANGDVILGTGGKYNPSTNSWTPTNPSGAVAVYDHAAVWTGTTMFVTGGAYNYTGPLLTSNSFISYNPLTDLWTTNQNFSNNGDGKEQHYSFLANNMILIWGGLNRAATSNNLSNTGYRYFLTNAVSSATIFTNETLYLYQKN